MSGDGGQLKKKFEFFNWMGKLAGKKKRYPAS
jgi:hypothetical protein